MGPILRLQPKLNIEQLYEQLDYSQGRHKDGYLYADC